MKKLRKTVFFPTFILMVLAVILCLTQTDAFLGIVQGLNTWVKINFGWLFTLTSLAMVVICVIVYFSPIGNKVIGGRDAKPLLGVREWFAVSLCTTVAAGMILWAAAEPIFHLAAPPAFLGIEPNSNEAAMFSLSTMFVHWTITPYAIYCVPGLMFAIAYYNMKQPYSFQGCISPAIGLGRTKKCLSLLDSICLFTMACGMASSLGTGILSVSGGVSNITGIASRPALWTLVACVIITVFIISSASGLMKGIRFLSTFNVRLFMVIILMLFIMGPTAYILNLTTESFGVFADNFFTRNLFTGTLDPEHWTHFWTISYFGNWMAWAPVTALFLGRISYGHTVKDFIKINLAVPSLFCVFWIGIFGGSAIYYHLNVQDLYVLIQAEGFEKVLYQVLGFIPLGKITIPLIVFATFISFVTAADSTINAMSGLCWKGTNPENPEAPTVLKILWGILIGSIAILMINTQGVAGLKQLSAFGGLPAMFLLILCMVSLMKVVSRPTLMDSGPDGNEGHPDSSLPKDEQMEDAG
uniref:BCCT family transporter n=1 Tax=Enterocloster hominis (ex Hitch et al. 2024) TaxID=1917870 RepID=UPI00103272D9|nr:BCCT family transporter [Lachnoclostridium pacaense]